jgi:hypothetical protein
MSPTLQAVETLCRADASIQRESIPLALAVLAGGELRTKEACAALGGIHPVTLWRMVKDGKLTARRVSHRCVVYSAAEVARLARGIRSSHP